MSITKALVEVKFLNNKIANQLSDISPEAWAKVLINPSSTDIQAFSDSAKANFQSLKDMIEREKKIKSAIAKANAVTTVTVGSETMTIAEAISLKSDYKKNLGEFITQIKQCAFNFIRSYERMIEIEKEKSDRELTNFIGKDKKITDDELKSMKSMIDSRHQVVKLDPLGIESLRDKVVENYNDFILNVDVALTEVNSKTMIDISD